MHKFKSRSRKNVIGLKLSGKLTRDEYQEIVPYLEEKIVKFGKIRLLVELDHWEGWGPYAALNDVAFVFKNSFKIERVAFLIKSKEDKQAILLDQPFSPWFRDNTRYFSDREKESAWSWISEGIQGIEMPQEDESDTPKRPEDLRFGPKMNMMIIGGGISGLSTAAFLQKRGFEPLLVESEKNIPPSNKMIFLWPAARSALKSIGVYKRVKMSATRIMSMNYYDNSSNLIKTLDLKPYAEEHGSLIAIPQALLQRILAKFIFPSTLHSGLSATDIEESNSFVKVWMSDGTEAHFDGVLCADGVNSRSREYTFKTAPAPYAGYHAFYFTVPSLPSNWPKDPSVFVSKEAVFQLIPSTDGDSSYVAAYVLAETDAPFDDPLQVLTKHGENFPPFISKALNGLEELSELQYQPMYYYNAEQSVTDRIALTGSSALNLSPFSMFTDSLSIQMAYRMCEKLCRSDSAWLHKALAAHQEFKNNYKDSLVEYMHDTVTDLTKIAVPSDDYMKQIRLFTEEAYYA